MNSYQLWKLENKGDILPEYDNPLQPLDEDEQHNSDQIDLERQMIIEEEIWFNEQQF